MYMYIIVNYRPQQSSVQKGKKKKQWNMPPANANSNINSLDEDEFPVYIILNFYTCTMYSTCTIVGTLLHYNYSTVKFT